MRAMPANCYYCTPLHCSAPKSDANVSPCRALIDCGLRALRTIGPATLHQAEVGERVEGERRRKRKNVRWREKKETRKARVRKARRALVCHSLLPFHSIAIYSHCCTLPPSPTPLHSTSRPSRTPNLVLAVPITSTHNTQ